MLRFLILAAVDFAVLILLASTVEISDETPVAQAIAYTLNPLALPAEWVARRFPQHGMLLVISAFVVGPLLWGAFVELMLRWFLDRPQESDSE